MFSPTSNSSTSSGEDTVEYVLTYLNKRLSCTRPLSPDASDERRQVRARICNQLDQLSYLNENAQLFCITSTPVISPPMIASSSRVNHVSAPEAFHGRTHKESGDQRVGCSGDVVHEEMAEEVRAFTS